VLGIISYNIVFPITLCYPNSNIEFQSCLLVPLPKSRSAPSRLTWEKRLDLFDAKARGHCLRVSVGAKSWSFVYRAKGSPKLRRLTVGDYPAWTLAAARQKALALRRMVQDGIDPAAEAKTRDQALTVKGLIERFIERYAKAKLRSWKDYEVVLKRDVIPAIGQRER
jgi:Arm DNA-binding domain